MSDVLFRKNNNILRMVYTSLMISLVFISTYAIKVPVPFTNGYIHPGDSMVFLSGVLLGPIYGALAAGIGSALSDLIAGYTFWVIPTLIIKALMGYIVGLMATKIKTVTFNVLTISFGLIWAGFTITTITLIKQTSAGNLVFASTLVKMIEESGSIMEASELTTLISNTSNYLLIILTVIPLFLIVLLLVNKFIQKQTLPLRLSVSFILGGIIMMFGYYLAYGIIVGNFIVPIFSIPSNMIQFTGAFIIASLLTPVVLTIKKSLTK